MLRDKSNSVYYTALALLPLLVIAESSSLIRARHGDRLEFSWPPLVGRAGDAEFTYYTPGLSVPKTIQRS